MVLFRNLNLDNLELLGEDVNCQGIDQVQYDTSNIGGDDDNVLSITNQDELTSIQNNDNFNNILEKSNQGILTKQHLKDIGIQSADICAEGNLKVNIHNIEGGNIIKFNIIGCSSNCNFNTRDESI